MRNATFFDTFYSKSNIISFLNKIVSQSTNKNVEIHGTSDLDGRIFGYMHRGVDNEGSCWHYDDCPMQCVFMLNRPNVENEGTTQFIRYRNYSTNHDHDDDDHIHNNTQQHVYGERISIMDQWWDDEKLTILLKNSHFYIKDDNNGNGTCDDNNVKNKDSNSNNDADEQLFDEMNSHVYSLSGQVGDVYCILGNEILHAVTPLKQSTNTRLVMVMCLATNDHFDHNSNAQASIGWTSDQEN